MDKQDWYKIFAIGLVAVFMIEGIAIGLMSGNNNGNAGRGQGQAGVTINGTATANVTIVRYEPYLIVVGKGAQADAAKQKLIDSGIATYAVPNEGGTIINLKKSSDAPDAALLFEGTNATVYVNAQVSLPATVRLEGEGLTTTVDGASFSMQMRPIYNEGEIVPASFSAQAQDGGIVAIGSFAFLPTYVQGVETVAELVSSSEESYLEVPWEARAVARQLVKNDNTAVYAEKSYVQIPSAATKAQLDAVMKSRLGYATGTQAGLISVRNDFTNQSMVEADLAGIGLASKFPASVMTFTDANESSQKAMEVATSLYLAGYGSSVVVRNVADVRLPEFVEKGGRNYSTGALEFSFEQTGPVSVEGVPMEIGFEAAGSRLVRLISARQLAAWNATNSTAAGNYTVGNITVTAGPQ